MYRVIATSILFFSYFYCNGQTDSLRQRIFLVGDAGELVNNTHPVIDWLRNNVDWNDHRNTVMYLGDNIYPLGLPMEGEPGFEDAKKILDYQINLVKGKKSKGFFVPGNHDWMNGKANGWQRVQNQVNYINGLGLKNVQSWPLNGCPGPIEVELDEKVVLVFVDSQWFLHINDKPGVESNCDAGTVDQFITLLQEIADRHPNQLLVLSMHHPMYTRGSHGGNYTLKTHIFPLTDVIPNLYIPMPVIGSIYPLTRGVFGNVQDVNHPLYRNMARQIELVLKSHPNAIQVAGHDHSLQLLVKDSIPYVVSGSGAKLTRVDIGPFTKFSDLSVGFATLDVYKSGKAEVSFYNLTAKDLSDPKFSYKLKPIQPAAVVAGIDTLYPLQPYFTVAGHDKIKTHGRKVFLHGKNYRAEWTTPVTVSVLDIKKEQGGLKPVRRAGSSQNKILSLENAKGKQWNLRSIREFPQSIIPADLVSPFGKDTVSDALSATYPYAALSIGLLEKATGIPSLQRKLVFVPDDPRLERFRKDFSSTLAWLEEREPAGVKQSISTDEMILQLSKDHNVRIDQMAVLRARLLDNFIMDFESQDDQWRWGARPAETKMRYFPFSGDHNQSFFVNEGFIPRMLRKPRYVPEIQGLFPKAYNIKTFNRSARNFDHFFLNELSDEEWKAEIDRFVIRMSDSVIDQSLQLQPEEIRQYSADRIASTLKQRREQFKKDMLIYYNFLSRKVDVVGSNNREHFLVEVDGNNHVVITVFAIDSLGKRRDTMYHRRFDEKVTNEIRLYGLNDDDIFQLNGRNMPITIRIIGGPGKDRFINHSSGGKVVIYDVNFEENTFEGNSKVNNRITANPQWNTYNRLSFKYDYSKLGLSFGFNSEDLFLIGPKFETVKQGFRKDPYGMRQYLSFNHSVTSASYQLKYEGDFTDAVWGNDLVLRTTVKKLGNTNFFGYGNQSRERITGSERDYFRAKYSIADGAVMLRKRLQTWMQIYYGLSYQTFSLMKEENKNSFAGNNNINGLDTVNMYDRKTFGGAIFRLLINSRNNVALPTRGFFMDLSIRPLFAMNNTSHNIAFFNLEMATFISLFNYPRFVLAARLGYGHNVGTFEYPQAQFLGGNENLRGYRRQRFAGRSMEFNNIELRFRIADFKVYLLPGAIGVLAFHDIGRVQAGGVRSNDWHTGFGGGVWISPIKRFVVTGILSTSKEEKLLPQAKIGFQF